jgi:HAE1 family hydrophobic/amphiphilic exporter-1
LPGAASVKPPTPKFVKLSDVATVKEDLSPSTSLTRTNGQPSLGISVVKTSSGNTVTISQAINKNLTSYEHDLGGNAKITVISDQAPSIQRSVNDLIREGLIGAIFAIIVILLFLFSLRSTLVTAISIPLSIIIALIGLYIGNYTLNILTLGGLTIAVGRVVDDSIVVLENIYRHLQEGQDKRTAIPAAVREVAGAITASTLTTVSVFLPVAFVGGIVGELFSSFAVAVTIALLASLLVALTIIPVLAYWFLKLPNARQIAKAQQSSKRGGSWLERGYIAMIGGIIGRWWSRGLTIVVAIAVLVITLGLSRGLQTNLFGSSGQNTFNVNLTTPPASSLDTTNSSAQKIEQVIQNLAGVKTYQVSVGSGGGFAALSGGGTNAASFSITTKDGTDNTAFEKTLRDKLATFKNLGTLTVSGSQGGPSSSNIEVDVKSANSNTLSQASQQVENALGKISGLTDITSNLANQVPQIQINVDSEKALKNGMTAAQVAQNVRLVYSGTTVSHITLNGTQQDVDLYVGTPATTVKDIQNLLIPTTTGTVKVGDLATVSQVNGPVQITHINTNRTASITATVTDTNVGAVSSKVQQTVNKLSLPNGASASLGGVTSDLNSTFSNLGLAVLIAIILVYCIMVATFRSILQPIVLLISIPFAATGSIILLLLTRIPLGAPALIGFLMLVGIVVTNAIVLVDLIKQYREKGLTVREAVIEGGRHRLRPILMTAIATILALVPMALGVGGSGGFISQPLAIVVIGGLTTSTILTLILVPTLYTMIEGPRDRKRLQAATPVEAIPMQEVATV